MRVLLPLMFIALLVAWESQSSGQSFQPLECKVAPNSVIVSFGATKHPTYFGIETPDDRFVYIRYPPKQIDVLGGDYFKREIELSLRDLSGFVINNGEKSPARVFGKNGKYQLIFQDANTAYGVDLHELSCSIRVSGMTAKIEPVTSQKPATSCQSLEGVSMSGKRGLIKSKFEAGCNYVGQCGVWPCCTQRFPGQPCFCNSCYIARSSNSKNLVVKQP